MDKKEDSNEDNQNKGDSDFDIELDYSAIIEATKITDKPKLGSISTEDILDEFRLPEENVLKYERSRENYYKLKNWSVITLIVGYLAGVVILYTAQAGGVRETIGTAVFGISLVFSVAILLLRHIFRNRAGKQNLDSEKATYHRLSKAIEHYQSENKSTETVRENLIATKFLMEQGQTNAFDTNFNNYLSIYLSEVSETQSKEYLEKTFPVMANSIIRHLALISIDRSEEMFRSHLKTGNHSDEPSRKDLVFSYFDDLLNRQILKVSAPFIVSVPLIVIIYIYIDERVA